MRNSESTIEEIDASKTLLFILISLVLTLTMASVMIIPDIQQLKVAKIHTTRSYTMLKRTQNYHDELSAEHRTLQEQNRKVIQALLMRTKPEIMSSFGQKHLGVFTIESSDMAEYDDAFMRHEMNVTTTINSPAKIYDFIDAVNRNDRLAEVTFPIIIEANEDYSLDVRMNLNVYELRSH